GHARVAPPCERQRCSRVVGQRGHEGLEAIGLEAQVWRKLPEQRTKLLAEIEQTRSEEVGERPFELPQAQDVRQIARALDRENKPLGRRRTPRGEARRRLQRIKRSVDFDSRELAREVREFIGLPQRFRIELAAPRRVAPARDPDADPTLFHGLPGQTSCRPPGAGVYSRALRRKEERDEIET